MTFCPEPNAVLGWQRERESDLCDIENERAGP